MGILGAFGRSMVLMILALLMLANIYAKQNPFLILTVFYVGLALGYYFREK
jgi:hypothetical protein